MDLGQEAHLAFQYASCLWVDLFYNTFYNIASNRESSTKESLSDRYLDVIKHFTNKFKRDVNLQKTLMTNIYNKMRELKHPEVISLTFSKFNDYYLSLFTPAGIVNKMVTLDKNTLITVISTHMLDRVTSIFSATNSLRLVISDHANQNNTSYFVDQVTLAYATERDNIRDSFIDKSIRDSEWVETVSYLRRMLMDSDKKNKELDRENSRLKTTVEHVEEQYNDVLEKYSTLYRRCLPYIKNDISLVVPGPLDKNPRIVDSDNESVSSSHSSHSSHSSKSSHSSRSSKSSRSTKSSHSQKSKASNTPVFPLTQTSTIINNDLNQLMSGLTSD